MFFFAVSLVKKQFGRALEAITCPKVPFAPGAAISAIMDVPPADSPAIVTLSGSPPKARIFS